MNTGNKILTGAFIALFLSACNSEEGDLATVDYVDLERFMGDWYVIANIPTFLEKGAHNAIENYSMNDDGTIATRFTFRADSFDGKPKEYNPRAWVLDTDTNARWGMRFVWPIKADYRVAWLDDDYSMTVIARQDRDYVWIMARTPAISDADYDRIITFVASIGYDTSKIERVPQQW
ncbi:MAG: lipocalin family protein [Woeseiaceae bacterium]|nr:lipocalin family protein [Woeseiaceae bacterium]